MTTHPKFIATGWNHINGSLLNIPNDVLEEYPNLLVFYSDFNSEAEIDNLTQFARHYFANTFMVNMEDLSEDDGPNGPTLDGVKAVKQFIASHATENMIVSCNVGVSRTGATIDYMMSQFGYQIDEQNLEYSNTSFSPNSYMGQLFKQLDPNFEPAERFFMNPSTGKWTFDYMPAIVDMSQDIKF